MTISRDVPIHGTGHTVGEILDAAAQAGGGGGSGTGFTSVADGDNIVTLTIEGAAEQGISLLGGPSSTENAGGTISIFAGSDVGGGGPGAVTIRAGNATTPNYDPGDVILLGGAAASTGRGGNVNINATAGNSADSGNVTIGLAPVTGTVGSHKAGQFKVLNLPTADPTVDNAIWSDNGVLVQSGHTAPSGVGFTEVDASNLALIPAVGVDVTINAGQDNSDAIGGGTIALKAGDDVQNGGAGNITLTAGQCVSDGAGAGNISLTAGAATVGNGLGGSIFLVSGQGVGAAAGGDIVLSIAGASGDGAPVGRIKLSGLPASDPSEGDAIWSDNGVLVQSGHTASGVFIPPTSDPQVAGALWNNAGTLAISAG